MKPADEIRRLIQESEIQSGPEVDARILGDALDQLDKRREERAMRPEPGVWRIIMRSNITKLAAAAVIVIAVLIGFHFVGNPLASTLTFARAIQPILSANSAILDIIVGDEKEDAPITHDMIMGSRIRRTMSNVQGVVSIIDLQSGRILTLIENKKEAVYVDLKGLPSMPNYLDQLKNVLTMLQDSPHFVTEDLGIQKVDGHEAVGFRAKHPKAEITLWADSRTGLPIRIVQKEGQLNIVCKSLQFDVPMDESLFSMEVPEGYKLQQSQVDLFGSTEADFIEGLRVLAERYGDGQFPDSVAIEDFMKRIPAMQEKEKELKLSPEEEAAIGSKIQKHILFLRFFKGEGKWYYRGKGIKLGDAASPIFWYRPKDSATYRVIYGDLHVEDAAQENLPEPPAADDVVKTSVGYQQWSKRDFVGTQIDYWYVLPGGKAQVKAFLTLLKGPKDTTQVPIRLPYANAPLEAVWLGDPADPSAKDITSLPFQKTGDGIYNIDLPIDKMTAGRTTIVCQWRLTLDDLRSKKGDYYETVLKSLIPVTSYYLKVAVDPGSGFELTDTKEGQWVTPFFQGENGNSASEFGSCGLMIRKRN